MRPFVGTLPYRYYSTDFTSLRQGFARTAISWGCDLCSSHDFQPFCPFAVLIVSATTCLGEGVGAYKPAGTTMGPGGRGVAPLLAQHFFNIMGFVRMPAGRMQIAIPCTQCRNGSRDDTWQGEENLKSPIPKIIRRRDMQKEATYREKRRLCVHARWDKLAFRVVRQISLHKRCAHRGSLSCNFLRRDEYLCSSGNEPCGLPERPRNLLPAPP